MRTSLTCVDCGRVRWTDLTEFDDMPIEQWWVSKGQRCVECRSRSARDRHRSTVRPGVLLGRRDGVAQRAGAVAGLPRSGTRRRQVFDAIRSAGERGVTFDELCERLGRSYSVTGPRVRELVTAGLVERSGERRPGSAGVLQEVWRVSVATVEAGL